MPVLERNTFKRGRSAVPESFPRTRRWRFWRSLFLSGLEITVFTSLVLNHVLCTKLENRSVVENQPLNIIYLFYLLYGERIHQRNGYLYLYMVLVNEGYVRKQLFDQLLLLKFRLQRLLLDLEVQK